MANKTVPPAAPEAVSIVIPVYNGAKTLARALDSVLAQSFTDFRALVVDDCSTDDTIAVVGRYSDPRITLMHHETNQGAAAARNTAIAQAQGRMVAFLDADDVWRPKKLERQAAFLDAADPKVGACFCDFMVHRGGMVLRAPRPRGTWFDSFLDGCFVSPGSTMVVRRDVYTQVGIYDTAFARLEDWDWLLRCAEHFDLAIVPEALVDVHITGDPSSTTVESSTQRMLEVHCGAVLTRRGKSGLRRFQASLALENVVAAARGGRTGRAVWCLARALVLSPPRVFTFIGRQIAKLLRLF